MTNEKRSTYLRVIRREANWLKNVGSVEKNKACILTIRILEDNIKTKGNNWKQKQKLGLYDSNIRGSD